MTVIVTVIFALIIVASSFSALMNIQEFSDTKELLSIYNQIVIDNRGVEGFDYSLYTVKGNSVRFTVIENDGTVIFDTEEEVSNLENHSDRIEIKEAKKNGSGTSVRYSETIECDLVYYATKVNESLIIRSSVPVSDVKIFTSENYKYYLGIIFIVILLSAAFSYKLVKTIIFPVKELEKVTAKIAGGQLEKRARIYNYDEIGIIAKTFNEMADQLQIKIDDVIDKQDKMEAILESMESGVIAIDNNKNIILINPYAKNLFNLKEDSIGKKIESQIVDYDIINFIINIPEINSREVKLFNPIERELRIKKAPIISGKSYIGTVITISDITDIKRLENMRSEFVANVSHELKTPLTSIKGFSETLKYVEDEETRNKFLNIINSESERLTRLINDILTLSNLENLNKMKNEEFRPAKAIKDCLDILKKEGDSKEIKISFDNSYDGILVGDRDKFYQMVINLIENAIKYSNEEGEVKVKLQDKEQYLYLIVEDNGIGIPEEDITRVFERFYRVDKARSTRGTGLGLAIVKYIVKLFYGDIDVQSEVGVGSKFTIKIKKIIDRY